MSTPLRMLIVEDRASDAELALAQLRRAGFAPAHHRVETKYEYLAHLNPALDLILADYSLPQFDALSALGLLRERGLDIPFIIFSGSIGEDTAVSALKQGADDYLLKDRLARLGPAVEQALERKKQRQEKQRAEDALRASEERFRALIEHGWDAVLLIMPTGEVIYASPSTQRILGYVSDEILSRNAFAMIHDEDRPGVMRQVQLLLEQPGGTIHLELRYRHKDCSWRWLECSSTNLLNAPGVRALVINYRDITERKLAEEALRESEEHYRLLFDRNPHPMWAYDLETLAFLAVNDAAVRHYGYTREEFLAMTIKDVRPPEEVDRLLDSIARHASGYENASIWKHRKKDGTLIDVEISSHTLDFSERPARVVLAHDVTERRLAERRLRESEERYRRLVETAPDAIYTLSTEGVITSMSPACERITGWKPAEVMGQMFTNMVHPDDVPVGMEVFQGILRGEPMFSYELRIPTKSGEYVVCDFTTTSQTDHGEVVGVLGIARDITERKRAEEERESLQAAITESAVEWQLTFDAIESPVLLLDAAGRVLRLNDAAKSLACGDDPDGRGKTLASLGDCPLWRKAAEVVGLVREQRVAVSAQAQDKASGRTWDLAANPALGPAAGDERIILVIRDVTRMVELQASLHRSETMSLLGSLVSGVAHEVRNPLFGISTTLDAFEARFGLKEEYESYLGVLRGEVDRLSDLMKDLLDYGRPISHELIAGSVTEIITRSVQACQPLAKQAEVKVVNRANGDLSLVRMDQKRLPQVFLNLLENAIQHSPPAGVVTVEATATRNEGRDWVVCVVRDGGPGFQGEDLPRLFEPFFTRRRGGTGLGLSIVQRIVEAHEGKISVSNHPEGGAMVTVKLPAIAL